MPPAGTAIGRPLLFFCVFSTTMIALLADIDCPPITLGEGSPLYPQGTRGGSITMYRVFLTEGNASKLNVTWSREPASLYDSASNFSNNTVISSGSLNASLSLWDLKLHPDFGNYKLQVCSNCTCNSTIFILYLFECDPQKLPQPVDSYHQKVIAETSLPSTLTLYMVFVGLPGTFYSSTSWDHGNSDVCIEPDYNKSHPFNCNRKAYGNCSFTANLYILNPRLSNAGNYTVQATIPGNSSRKATYELDIVREPSITCSQHDIVVGGKLDCTIRNYSVYIDVLVVEDDVKEIAHYPASQLCKKVPLDSTVAKCSVGLGEGRFNVCVNYSSSVNTTRQIHQCSNYIHVHTTSFWEKNKTIIIVPLVVVVVVVACAIIGVIVFLHLKRRRAGNQPAGQTERTRLLQNQDNIDPPQPPSPPPPPPPPPPQPTECTDQVDVNPLPPQLLGTGSAGDEEVDRPLRPQTVSYLQAAGQAVSSTSASSSGAQKKITLIYAKNPGRYEQIAPPEEMTASEEREYEQEVAEHEGAREDRIKAHCKRVERLVCFLEALGMIVAYERQLDDEHVSSKPNWLVENVETSDFVVLVITPSFKELLHQKKVPDDETFFKGDYLSNYLSGHSKKPDGSHIKFVCVFLGSSKREDQIPPYVATANSYALIEPFDELGEGRRDDIMAFKSLMTKD